MRFVYWPTCPFACKVLGVLEAIELPLNVEYIPMHPWEANSPLSDINPLHKIPVLIDEFGDTFYDSRVICEYLDTRHRGERLMPKAKSQKRWDILRTQALADGLSEAALLKVLEQNVRASHNQSIKWMARQQRIIEASLAELERLSPTFHDEPVNIGLLSVSAALGYLSYRFGPSAWRGTHPRLSTWHAKVIDLPVYSATLPQESQPLPELMERLDE